MSQEPQLSTACGVALADLISCSGQDVVRQETRDHTSGQDDNLIGAERMPRKRDDE